MGPETMDSTGADTLSVLTDDSDDSSNAYSLHRIPPALRGLVDLRTAPTNAVTFSSFSTQSSSLSYSSSSTITPGIGYVSGKAVYWIGEKILCGIEPIEIGRRRWLIQRMVKKVQNLRIHRDILAAEQWLTQNVHQLRRATIDLLELVSGDYPTRYKSRAEVHARTLCTIMMEFEGRRTGKNPPALLSPRSMDMRAAFSPLLYVAVHNRSPAEWARGLKFLEELQRFPEFSDIAHGAGLDGRLTAELSRQINNHEECEFDTPEVVVDERLCLRSSSDNLDPLMHIFGPRGAAFLVDQLRHISEEKTTDVIVARKLLSILARLSWSTHCAAIMIKQQAVGALLLAIRRFFSPFSKHPCPSSGHSAVAALILLTLEGLGYDKENMVKVDAQISAATTPELLESLPRVLFYEDVDTVTLRYSQIERFWASGMTSIRKNICAYVHGSYNGPIPTRRTIWGGDYREEIAEVLKEVL